MFRAKKMLMGQTTVPGFGRLIRAYGILVATLVAGAMNIMVV